MKSIIVIVMGVCFFLVSQAFSTTYYVATDGNDANPGTFALPWKSIVWALEDNSVVVPGDKILFKAGTYTASEHMSLTISSVTLSVASGLDLGDVVWDMNNYYLRLQGTNQYVSKIKFQNIDILRIYYNNTYVVSNEIHGNGSGSIGVEFNDDLGYNCVVAYNNIFNVDRGIYCDFNSQGHPVGNNYIAHNNVELISSGADWGIQLETASNSIYTNHFFVAGGGTTASYMIDIRDSADGEVIKGNIFENASAFCVRIDAGNHLIEDNKILFSSGGIDIGAGEQTIIANVISNTVHSVDEAIYSDQVNPIIIKKNTITGFTNPVYLNNTSGQGAIVISNLIYNNGGYNIWNKFSYSFFADNILHHAIRGIQISAGSHNKIIGNIAHNNSHSGFYTYSTSDVGSEFVGNVSYSNTKFGFGYFSGQNILFLCNLAYRNGEGGFFSKNSGSGSDLMIFKHNTSCFNKYGFQESSTFTTCSFSNNITYSNNVGIGGTVGFTAYYSCINDGVSNVITLGTGCVTNDPLFYSPNVNDFNLKWNSPIMTNGNDQMALTSIGRWTGNVITTNTNIGDYSKYIISFLNEGNAFIPNDAIIKIHFERGKEQSFFGLNSISHCETTSSWGGGSPTFSYSIDSANQTITITRTGGNASAPEQSENIILYPILNAPINASNYNVSISVYSNSGRCIFDTIANNFRLTGKSPFLYMKMDTIATTLNTVSTNQGSSVKPLPGTTITFSLMISNIGNEVATNVHIENSIPTHFLYLVDSMRYLNSGNNYHLGQYLTDSQDSDRACISNNILIYTQALLNIGESVRWFYRLTIDGLLSANSLLSNQAIGQVKNISTNVHFYSDIKTITVATLYGGRFAPFFVKATNSLHSTNYYELSFTNKGNSKISCPLKFKNLNSDINLTNFQMNFITLQSNVFSNISYLDINHYTNFYVRIIGKQSITNSTYLKFGIVANLSNQNNVTNYQGDDSIFYGGDIGENNLGVVNPAYYGMVLTQTGTNSIIFQNMSIEFAIVKKATNISLQGAPLTQPIPGASIKYVISYSNKNNGTGHSCLIYDKLPTNVVYYTNYMGTATGWTLEYSTNMNPSQSWNSVDYNSSISFEKSKIKWLRWKKDIVNSSEDGLTLIYSVIVK